jgi:hypothetical protein
MMSSETVGALDKMGDAARRMWLQMKANIGENFVSLMTLTLPIVRQVGSELDAMATSAAKALPGMKDLAPVGLPSDLATIDAQLRSIARTKEENYQVDLRLKKLREEINKLELEGSQITAGALGLSRQEQEQTQKGFESQLRGYDSIEKASAALRDFRIKATNDAVDYEIWKLWDEVAQEEKAFKGAEAQRSEYNAVVEELATEQAQKLRDAADSAAVGVEAIATAEFHAAAGAVAFHDSLNLIVTGMRDYKQFGQEGWFGYAPTGAAPAFINAAGVRPFSPTAPTAAGTYTPPPGGGLGGRGTSVQVGDVHVNGFSGDASGLADKIARQLMNEITRTAPVPLTR